ncbi:MAG: peptidase M15 [Bacteroidaceae bacterium]|nr:peptidase M15 [Bacteroidaceae bacterium]
MTNDILLSPHFKLREFIASRTAEEHGIDNTPPDEAVENLRRLCEGCLEPLREALGLPVVVTSGFRTKALNSLLAHSSERSQHMLGQAADLYIGHTENTESTEKASRRELLIKAFREVLTNPKIDFDQIILYPTFIHVSFVSRERNRRGILLAQGNGKLGYGRLSLSSALQIV